MTAPVYVGMPSVDRVFEVGHWGNIRCGGPCKDDYARIEHFTEGGRLITLQKAAMDSFRSAETECGPIVCTGTWRPCSLQTALYAKDSSRYARPDSTAHCRGLAIDVATNQTPAKLKKIHDALMARHWHQARSDEKWHWSMGIEC
jgi:hypothetical protein